MLKKTMFLGLLLVATTVSAEGQKFPNAAVYNKSAEGIETITSHGKVFIKNGITYTAADGEVFGPQHIVPVTAKTSKFEKVKNTLSKPKVFIPTTLITAGLLGMGIIIKNTLETFFQLSQ